MTRKPSLRSEDHFGNYRTIFAGCRERLLSSPGQNGRAATTRLEENYAVLHCLGAEYFEDRMRV
jgi:hypothetical protein